MILNQDRKSHSVMVAMTMDPSNAAAYWVLRFLLSMCPPFIYIINKTMFDLALGMTLINNALPNFNLAATCIWHIMVIDFPKNMKHIPSYDSFKKYVYDRLVRNTMSKIEWVSNMAHTCQ